MARPFYEARKTYECIPCAQVFPSSAHLGSHKRYTHGAGLRRTPLPEPPKPAVPARVAPNAVPVPAAAISLPWIAFPRDSTSCEAIAALALRIAEAPHSEAVQKFWQTLAAHVTALPAVRDRELTIQEAAMRQKIQARRFA